MISTEDGNIGKTYGCYEIIGLYDKKTNQNKKIYIGKCVRCGKIRYATSSGFYSSSKNCFHVNNETERRILSIYNGMRFRCYKSKDELDIRYYRNKNIKIFQQWLDDKRSFIEWSLENGYKVGLTIDRIDSNGNYCPDNCRWVTHSFNSKFTSDAVVMDVNGIIDTRAGWAKRIGKDPKTIYRYIKQYGIENVKEMLRRYMNDDKNNRPTSYIYKYYMCQ